MARVWVSLCPVAGLLCVFAGAKAAGQTESVPQGGELKWQNASLSVTWRAGTASLALTNTKTGDLVPIPIGIGPLDFDAGVVPGLCRRPGRPTLTNNDSGQTWRFVCPEVSVPNSPAKLRGEVRFELDTSTPWIRKRASVELAGGDRPLLLKRVEIDTLRLEGQDPRQPFGGWQSYPVLGKSFFCGVAFPVANASVKGDTVRLSYRPGRRLAPGAKCDIWPAVYGVSAAGQSRALFESYIASLRPASPGLHIQYNTWWSARGALKEQDMLQLVETLRANFHEPFGARLDAFCLDLGWTNRRSIWKIDPRCFPRGFTNLTRALHEMDCRLSLWVSPSSVYPPAQDNHWAEKNGYETCDYVRGHRRACLGGDKYQRAFKESLVDLTRRYRIDHFKFDGYVPTCPRKDHGHEAGELSAEKTALGMIDIFQAVREANPNVWFEATCFGFCPSPWWLAYVNTVIGTYGDDAPRGRVPCPVYRESYTTARDFFNLRGTKDVLVPICAQEVLGIVHQTPEPFQNDAVVTILRGHDFVPLYVNPKYMDARRWRFLARLCTWARKNVSLLKTTKAVRFGDWADDAKSGNWGQPLPRDPYGYAHFEKGHGLVMLRNPWVRPRHVRLSLDASIGCPNLLGNVSAVCLYPCYGTVRQKVSHGDHLDVRLAPYETKLLAFGGHSDAQVLPDPSSDLFAAVAEFDVREADGQVQIRTRVSGTDRIKQLWVLYESGSPLMAPYCELEANGSSIKAQIQESGNGWRASGRSCIERWVWLVADLPAGASAVRADLEILDGSQLSAWVVSAKQVLDDADDIRPIPPPEVSYLDAIRVLAPVPLKLDDRARLTNLALARHGSEATASSKWGPEYDASQSIDGKPATRWNSAAGDKGGAWLEIDFGAARTIKEVRFQEAAGGRITRYAIQSWQGDGWQDILTTSKPATRTKVRHRFPPLITTKVRLLIGSATEVPTLYEFEVYGKL